MLAKSMILDISDHMQSIHYDLKKDLDCGEPRLFFFHSSLDY